MNFALKDLFLGVVHLFVIFLPGSVVLLTLLYLAPSLQTVRSDLGITGAGAALFFIGASYFLGHLASMIASAIEDSASTGPRRSELGESKAAVRRVAHEICAQKLGREVVSAKTIRRWSAILVRKDNGILQTDIDSKDADRRFFRNICLVLLFPFCVAGWRAWTGPQEVAHLYAALGFAVLTMLAILRYIDQDAKFTRLVFESLIALNSTARMSAPSERTIATHAGGVVCRRMDRTERFLLVRPLNQKDQWLLPKGHIECGESPEEAAVREIREETGVVAKIWAFLDFSEFAVDGKQVRLANYLLTCDTEVPEGGKEGREIAWLEYEQALGHLSFSEGRSILCEAKRLTRLIPRS